VDAWDGGRLDLDQVGGALAVCDAEGLVWKSSPAARRIFAGMGITADDSPEYPHRLPPALWGELTMTPIGEAVQWEPEQGAPGVWLGVTRYHLGEDMGLLVMREFSDEAKVLAHRLHHQRLAITGGLVAGVAHDLRTAIGCILYNAESVLERGLDADRTPESLRDIRDAARHLRQTVDSLLAFASRGRPSAGPTRVSELLATLNALLQPRVREGRHSLVLDLRPRSLAVQANSIYVEQILANLLVNAMEASSRPLRMTVRCRDYEGALVRFRVSDDGPGIPEHLRNRIFEPFFTAKPTGSGLGLTMARSTAREMGGDLVLTDTDAGTTFDLFVPRAPDLAR
jgi:signal transduction histidine kinase